MRTKIFVNKSAKLVSVSSLVMRQMRAATASLHLWYGMLWCLLRNTESGVGVFFNPSSLSYNMPVGPSSGTPNMRRFYHNTITNLTAILIAVNLDPEVNVSTEFCFLLSHITGAWLQNINMPVCDHLINFSDVDIGLPLGCGISSGIASFTSR